MNKALHRILKIEGELMCSDRISSSCSTIALSVPLPYTDSDYPFGIFKLFLPFRSICVCPSFLLVLVGFVLFMLSHFKSSRFSFCVVLSATISAWKKHVRHAIIDVICIYLSILVSSTISIWIGVRVV